MPARFVPDGAEVDTTQFGKFSDGAPAIVTATGKGLVVDNERRVVTFRPYRHAVALVSGATCGSHPPEDEIGVPEALR